MPRSEAPDPSPPASATVHPPDSPVGASPPTQFFDASQFFPGAQSALVAHCVKQIPRMLSQTNGAHDFVVPSLAMALERSSEHLDDAGAQCLSVPQRYPGEQSASAPHVSLHFVPSSH